MPTHLIGAALFRGEWKTAVSMILDPREGDILCIVCVFCEQKFLFACLFLTQVACHTLSMALQEQFVLVFLNFNL